ncbi:hypothetical protein [Spartinivicinus ruber]|uniref:hypothetical protein n=1 Tax=Spartinivicinus ruber TaxID=2683272 RepID=UPI0013D3B0DD|nr:hypothetical protein [Spartinivicinus ruber]
MSCYLNPCLDQGGVVESGDEDRSDRLSTTTAPVTAPARNELSLVSMYEPTDSESSCIDSLIGKPSFFRSEIFSSLRDSISDFSEVTSRSLSLSDPSSSLILPELKTSFIELLCYFH